ncbi:MAG: ABC transporter substrate-binding protein [Chloroflexi bacterium]|nr:ABC transporter substrate-binding protein [Chloroflexota bacterium]
MSSGSGQPVRAWGMGRRRFVGSGLLVTGAAAVAAACGGNDNKAKSTQAPSGTQQAAGSQAAGGTQAAATTAASPGAQAGTPVKGQILVAQIPNVFDSTDVHRALGDPTLWTSNYLYNKLVRYKNPDTGEIEPDLAEKFEAPDAATYTFNLRKGVKWQPPISREFTAEDVRWHIERQANGKLKDGSDGGFTRSAFFKTVAKIETPDQYTVKLTLSGPNGTFLDRLSGYFSTLPNRETTEKFEQTHRTLTEEAMIGTGPFIATQFRAGQTVKFKRNPEYFRKDEPLLDGWVAPLLFEDPNAYRAAFLQKQVDGWGSPDVSQTKKVIDDNKGAMYEILNGVGNTVFLHLNRNKQFKDIRLIKAMNMAVDRAQLIQTFHQGLGQNSGVVTWLQEGFAIPPAELEKLQGYRKDREIEKKEARDLWAAGGGPALGEIDIRIPDTWLANWPDTTQIIPKMFNDALGVTQFRSTKATYNEDIIANLGNGNFPNWFAWTSQVNSPDPRSDLRNGYHTKGSLNFNKVGSLPGDPNLDAALDEVTGIVDQKQAIAKVRAIQNTIMENAMFGNVVLYNYIGRSANWNYLKANLKVPPSAGKAASAYNIFAGHLLSQNTWIDTKDASYSGRAPTPN